MVSLDIFHADPFKTIQLTTAVEKVPYVPDGIEMMGIFEDKPIRTEALMIEQRQGKLVLIPFSDRGAPGVQRTTEQRQARYWSVPRIRMEDTIYARELMGIREFGTETVLMQVQKELARRLVGPTGLRNNLRFTQEYHRLAALQGYLLNTDGSVKFNWFTEFGITPNPEVAYGLVAKTLGSLRPICNEVVRTMKRKAQGAFLNSTRVVGLCGDDFWDYLVTHPDVEKTYLNWAEATDLRKGQAFESYTFGGIDWVNYRGSDDTLGIPGCALVNGSPTVTPPSLTGIVVGQFVSGPNIAANVTVSSINTGAGTFAMSANYGGVTGTYTLNIGFGNVYTGGGTISIPSNKAIFFPRGAPEVFQRALAPADSFEWEGQLGKPEYVQMIYDRDRQEWVKAEMTAYPLHICTRPEMLFTATLDAAAD